MTALNHEKPKIAFFDFACCEGCQLTVLRLNQVLFDFLEQVEVAAWREVMTGGKDDYDIAFCEGSIRSSHDMERILKIRDTAKTVVALGSCAAIGCHNALKNHWPVEKLRETVYRDPAYPPDVIAARPISEVVSLDYEILGCPASLSEAAAVFKAVLTGQPYTAPNDPVCVECKRNDHLCVLEKGIVCLGPVTRCGCQAICTRFGDACHGCRGLVDGANVGAALRVLTTDQHHSIMMRVRKNYDLSEADIYRKIGVYNILP